MVVVVGGVVVVVVVVVLLWWWWWWWWSASSGSSGGFWLLSCLASLLWLHKTSDKSQMLAPRPHTMLGRARQPRPDSAETTPQPEIPAHTPNSHFPVAHPPHHGLTSGPNPLNPRLLLEVVPGPILCMATLSSSGGFLFLQCHLDITVAEGDLYQRWN